MSTDTPTRRDHTYVDDHGVTIHYSVWSASQPKAVIQLLHGLGEHSLRYDRLARELVAAGYTVYADDHRGHGRTGLGQYDGDHARLGKLGVGGMRATIAAIHQFTQLIRAENPDLPLVALGQSWGSLMLQILLNEHSEDFDGVVLTGTAYRTLTDMNSGDLNKRHKHLGTTGNEWLSRDVSVHTAFSEDPLNFYAAASKLFGLVDGARLLGRPARDLPHDVPVLILIGSEDSLGGERSIAKLARDYVERSGLSDVEAVVYPEARHEVFHEINRDEVVADLIAWLDAHTAR
jgi:alpha-beta hydrolase superfamily lysophospholipase